MKSDSKLLLNTFRKEKTSHVPFWFMRQAGRYLPEYKELRGTEKNFIEFCLNPKKASEATLQPVRRFGMDGAIIFSDILVVPYALGVDVRFEEGKGPLLVPVTDETGLTRLILRPEKLEPVYEALKLTKAALPDVTTLIGFTGSPWTLACYMIQGKSDKDFHKARALALTNKPFFTSLIDVLVKAVSDHAINQIKAGAEVIQLFDSWSGVLSENEFNDYVIKPTKAVVTAIHSACPGVPVIGFPRMAGSKIKKYIQETGVDGVSIDGSVSLDWVRLELAGACVVQGNLDPLLLATDIDATLAQARHIISQLGDKPFVFNLGHGILPHTPVANVQALSEYLKS